MPAAGIEGGWGAPPNIRVYSPGPSEGAGALGCGNCGVETENALVALVGRAPAAGVVGLA